MTPEEQFADDYSRLLIKHDVEHSVIITFDEGFENARIIGTRTEKQFIIDMLQAAINTLQDPTLTYYSGLFVTSKHGTQEVTQDITRMD